MVEGENDSPEAHLNRAAELLRDGDFSRGLIEFEWRLKCRQALDADPKLPIPHWDGRSVPGRRLLIHAEGGYGDTFQLIRYVPLVAQRGAHVTIGCRAELKPVLERVDGIDDFLLVGDKPGHYDYQVSLGSLPFIFGTTLETIPTPPGPLKRYLEPPSASLLALWRRRVARPVAGFRVGIAWRGRQLPDPGRSIPLAYFAPLACVPSVVFHSLQVDEGANEVINPPPGMQLVDHASDLSDFGQTAALIENLDLIISIDTAVAHLAGAMGKPVFTLLQFLASYQWLRDRDDSPWYPTMRLFRQPHPYEWNSVIQAVAVELTKLVAGN